MLNIDYREHNEKVKALLDAEKSGRNSRVLMKISSNPRMILSDPALNPDGVEFETYIEDPAVMLDVQCRFAEYLADYLVWDKIMGFDNVEGIALWPDSQNLLEPEWFGCQPVWHGTSSPGTRPCLTEADKHEFTARPFPEIHKGITGKALDFTSYFEDLKCRGYEYKGKPITEAGRAGLSTDGPFTVGCCILGATELCVSIYEDPEFVRDFLSYITDATIFRIKKLRSLYELPELSQDLVFADDSIALLSIDTYEDFVMPLHKKLVDELTSEGTNNSIHLCGNATHLFPTIHKNLNVFSFDTGFPVNFAEIIRRLGSETAISGGVHVDMLLNGDAEKIQAETRRILEEVKPLTRRFTIKEANNLSPGTRPENLLAMYRAVEAYGAYE